MRLVLLGALSGAVAICLTPGAGAAADWTFSPALELLVYRDGNPRVVGQDPQSDGVTRGQFDLDLAALTRQTTWTLSYRLFHETYVDDAVLDNNGQRLSSTLRHKVSEKSDLRARFYADKGEQQRVRREIVDVPDSVVPRTDIHRLYASADGRLDTGRRNFVTWTARGSINRYEDLPPSPAVPNGIEYNDSNQILAGAGWGRNLSRNTSMGLEYAHRHISYEKNSNDVPDTDTDTIAVTTRHTLGPKTNLSAALGIQSFTRKGESRKTTPGLYFNVSRELDRFNDLVCGVRQVITPGTGVGGATEDRGGYVNWHYRPSRLWRATIAMTYWHRKTVVPGPDEGNEGFRTLSSLWWIPWRYLSFGIFHSYTNQNQLSSAQSAADTSYNTGGFTVRWEILGNNYGRLGRGR